VAYDNSEKRNESIHSIRIKAGKRRTYFFDVRNTKSNDYFITITESVKRFNEDNYDRHKIFLYKEDFNKFLKGITEAVDHIKVKLMPDFDFDAFAHEYTEEEIAEYQANLAARKANQETVAAPIEDASNNEAPSTSENVDKW
jgi:uncharacterized protein with von Willebrand factor type A (vWA) domain